MTQSNLSIRLTGADIALGTKIERSEISISDGIFANSQIGAAVDLTGYYLLPALLTCTGTRLNGIWPRALRLLLIRPLVCAVRNANSSAMA